MALPGVATDRPLYREAEALAQPLRTRRSIEEEKAEERASILSRLPHARVATASDKTVLDESTKQTMHMVKVLGEGAFGIVDLVLVDDPAASCTKEDSKGGILCVRKKLLKQTKQNFNDPAMEVEFFQDCAESLFVVHMYSHVVGLYDFTLLLEYCPFGSMDNLIKRVSKNRSQSGNACLGFLLEYILKTDRHDGLTEDESRFWVANCVLGLEFMHSRGLLHRDLKPANLLIGDNRYCKLGDLGLVKRLGEDGKAYTHSGTPGYMAPEIVHSKGSQGAADLSAGYGYPADIWSLGITVWEMVDGKLPNWAILSWYFTRLHFPEKFSPKLRDLLTRMLNKAPSERITLAKMKQHPWFEGIDWIAMEKQTLEGPDFAELREHRIHTNLK